MKPSFELSDVTGIARGRYYHGAFNESLLAFGEIAGGQCLSSTGGRNQLGTGFTKVEFFSDSALTKPIASEVASALKMTVEDRSGTQMKFVAVQTEQGLDFKEIEIRLFGGAPITVPPDARFGKVLKAVNAFHVRLSPGAKPGDRWCLGDELCKEFGTTDGGVMHSKVLAGGIPVVPKPGVTNGGGALPASRTVSAPSFS